METKKDGNIKEIKSAEISGNASEDNMDIKVLRKIKAGQKSISTNEDIRAYGYIDVKDKRSKKTVWELKSYREARSKKSNFKNGAINQARRIKFGDKKIYALKGLMPDDIVCEACGKTCREERAEIGRRLAYHHEIYDEKDPLAYTIILCSSCHAKLHNGTLNCLMTHEES